MADRHARALPAQSFVRVPLAELTTPKAGLLRCIANHYWLLTAEGEALFYEKKWHSPQCNSNRAVLEHALKDLCPIAARVELVPVAFVPHRCEL